MGAVLFIVIWIIFGLGLGVLFGLIARAVCRRRGMYQLADRAFWICMISGILNCHVIAMIIFIIIAYTRDNDVGGGGGYVNPPVYGGGYAPARAMRLMCVSGPLSGQSYFLNPGVLSIGTDASNVVRLPVGTPGVSRRHCSLRYQNGVLQLVDEGSSYGTFLMDGRRLPPQYPTAIGVGSRFYLGNTGCMFQIAA